MLAGIIAQMHDDYGRVAIEGFYDGVPEIPPALRRIWTDLAEAAHILENTDLAVGTVEAGYSPLEAIWGRPTLDLNGMMAGNLGPGERSVLPASATARLSFRLVGGQDPARIRQIFRQFVSARLPDGCRAEFEGSEGSPAVVTPLDNPFMQAMSRALRGTAVLHHRRQELCRFIPAGAGNRSAAGEGAPVRSVHPRGCGEQLPLSCGAGSQIGSSPRVRGTVIVVIGDCMTARFIPAGAGNRRPRRAARRGSPVHPRGCGEQGRPTG